MAVRVFPQSLPASRRGQIASSSPEPAYTSSCSRFLLLPFLLILLSLSSIFPSIFPAIFSSIFHTIFLPSIYCHLPSAIYSLPYTSSHLPPGHLPPGLAVFYHLDRPSTSGLAVFYHLDRPPTPGPAIYRLPSIHCHLSPAIYLAIYPLPFISCHISYHLLPAIYLFIYLSIFILIYRHLFSLISYPGLWSAPHRGVRVNVDAVLALWLAAVVSGQDTPSLMSLARFLFLLVSHHLSILSINRHIACCPLPRYRSR